jgi:hypothetical protein
MDSIGKPGTPHVPPDAGVIVLVLVVLVDVVLVDVMVVYVVEVRVTVANGGGPSVMMCPRSPTAHPSLAPSI